MGRQMAALAQQQQQLVEIIQRQQTQLSHLATAQQQPPQASNVASGTTITVSAAGIGMYPQTVTAAGKLKGGRADKAGSAYAERLAQTRTRSSGGHAALADAGSGALKAGGPGSLLAKVQGRSAEVHGRLELSSVRGSGLQHLGRVERPRVNCQVEVEGFVWGSVIAPRWEQVASSMETCHRVSGSWAEQSNIPFIRSARMLTTAALGIG